MIPNAARIPLIGAASAFGAIGLVFALVSAGAPFLLAAVAASACAGLVMHMAAPRPAEDRPEDRPEDPPEDRPDAAQVRIDQLEAQAAALRHDLRGALSPALMMSDRLVSSPDPAMRRAGETVVRSIERATALIATSRPQGQNAAPPNPGR